MCTNTDEESSGVGGLACARHGVAADFAIVPEPSSLEIWPACRGSVYCSVELTGRAGHTEQEHPSWRDGGAVNAIDTARFLLAGVDRLRADWRSRRSSRHPLLDPPDIVASRLVADAGWPVTLPDRAEITLAVLILPAQADADGWTRGVQAEVEGFLRTWCDADPWLAANPPSFAWHTEVNPSETPTDAASVRTLLAVNEALGLPPVAGLTRRLVRRRDVRARGRHARAHVRPQQHRPRAHRRRVGADRRPRRVRAGARAGRLAPVPLTQRAIVSRAVSAAELSRLLRASSTTSVGPGSGADDWAAGCEDLAVASAGWSRSTTT